MVCPQARAPQETMEKITLPTVPAIRAVCTHTQCQ
jgi:hypothetical protein